MLRGTALLVAVLLFASPPLRLFADLPFKPEVGARVLSAVKELDEVTLSQMVEVLLSLSEAKPETATRLFEDFLVKSLEPDEAFHEKTSRNFARFSGRLSFAQAVEYIGFNRLSQNLMVVVFALNCDYGVHYFAFDLQRQSGAWRFHGYQTSGEVEEMAVMKSRLEVNPVVVHEFSKRGR